MKIKLFFFWVITSLYVFAQPPKANFDFTYTVDGENKIVLQIVNNSKGDDLQYEWISPEAALNNSKLADPQVTYNNVGEYNLTLKVKNNKGESSLSKKIMISRNSSNEIINLSTGIDNNGITMKLEEPDISWTVTNTQQVTGIPITREKYREWYTPMLETNTIYNEKTNWIRSKDLYTGNGDYYYKSKIFLVPEHTIEAKLSFVALAFVRHWTYLVKINDDGSETDIEEISRTLWLNDGVKGWFNSRTSKIENYKLTPGKYYIKSRVYTNNGNLRDAFSANGFVTIGDNIKVESSDLDNNTDDDVIDKDWTKAPNSYIFDINTNNNGLLIPIKKAYAMWEEGTFMGKSKVPSGKVTADVYWEDVPGLVKSNVNYTLDIVGTGKNSKIKVPINKVKKGNAVIVFKVDGKIYWSWHVWVTDDPSNGSNYMSVDGVRRELKNGKTEVIPAADWGWMDRNLGAISSGITEEGWTRNNGLLYQWGRKDPIPPLVTKGDDFYEVSGSVGRIRHRHSYSNAVEGNDFIKIDDLVSYIPLSKAQIENNIRLSVNNPLSLIYVNADNSNSPAYYTSSTPVNWFGTTTTTNRSTLAETNLWSDNSKGIIRGTKAYNWNSSLEVRPYRDKSSYDPCPNGWRIPSMIVNDIGKGWKLEDQDLRLDYSPFGLRTQIGDYEFRSKNIIKPTDNGSPTYFKGMKVYSGIGVDATSVSGYNMGLFPGTGMISRFTQGGQYTDQHEVYLWTATMARWFDSSASVSARYLHIVPDGEQSDIPDSNIKDVTGRYLYNPLQENGGYTSNAMGCRCIKDPLYIVNEYDFPTEYFTDNVNYESFTDGLSNPNTYQLVKSSKVSTIKIPINKAFSVQSEYLNNKQILNNSNYNNLKTNILWTTNTNLIKKILVSNSNPGSLLGINNTTINVEINPNEIGNAVVTLHNGSITNPVYWSWHVWVTDNEIKTIRYATRNPNRLAYNYINYAKHAEVLDTEFMDRNLGAIDVFPTVKNADSPTATELQKIKLSGGLEYQWGRKDPIPSFTNPDGSIYDIYLGKANDNGLVSYTKLDANTYNNSGNYIVPYNKYSKVLTTDKTSEKISKNLLYSVQNPLVYMVPSKFSSSNTSYPNKSNGTDWLSEEVNLAQDRWGRGDIKSPFDPCPDGWRIPDVTSSTVMDVMNGTIIKNKGLSPWQSKDIPSSEGKSIKNVYKGITVGSFGYNFNDSDYNIGNYPFVGIRGFRDVTSKTPNPTPSYLPSARNYSGIWTASLNGNYLGRPIGLFFFGRDILTPYSDNFDPYNALSCRCVKIKETVNGLQEGAHPRMEIPPYVASIEAKELTKEEVKSINEKSINLFPNPVNDILNINGNSNEDYFYQIYDLTGKVISKGKFINNKINVSQLKTGIYLIRVNDSKEVTKIIKK